MAALDLRPLSLGELLDRTFFLYRRHFLLFIGIAAVPYLVILVPVLAGLMLYGLPARTGPPSIVPAAAVGGIVLIILAAIAVFVAFLLFGWSVRLRRLRDLCGTPARRSVALSASFAARDGSS